MQFIANKKRNNMRKPYQIGNRFFRRQQAALERKKTKVSLFLTKDWLMRKKMIALKVQNKINKIRQRKAQRLQNLCEVNQLDNTPLPTTICGMGKSRAFYLFFLDVVLILALVVALYSLMMFVLTVTKSASLIL
jgi:hypothetical protein